MTTQGKKGTSEVLRGATGWTSKAFRETGDRIHGDTTGCRVSGQHDDVSGTSGVWVLSWDRLSYTVRTCVGEVGRVKGEPLLF